MNHPNPSTPPADRYCDLVMKGGITSGVVYPVAISRLATQYRFRSIGGTSAGAIAAAVTAAAEYQRRCSGSSAGFDRLAGLPLELSKLERGGGARKLLSLFQPQEGAHRLFNVLVSALNSRGTYRRIGAVLWGLAKAYKPVTLGALIAAILAWRLSSPLAGVLLGLIVLAGGWALWLLRDLAGPVVGNGFGLCNGMPGHRSERAALTPWLHELIQEAAGRRGGPPLTFGDLWDAPGAPAGSTGAARAIDLQMFSTNLAHGRPYVFPLNETARGAEARPGALRSNERLYFSPEALKPYLPDDVHDWMVAHGRPYEPEPGREGRDPDAAAAVRLGLLEIPAPRDFPVLLAARMSLSFPLLFSAVPLWAIDHDAPPGQREFRRCWFSDGGICSNFPMHLFDGLVPRWPTFGITLEPRIEGREMVYLPQGYREGYGERWSHFDRKADGLGRFGGFLAAIVGTMQDWNDNSLARMPGVRDRVARVRLNPDEGGLNLDMEQDLILGVSARGREAADELIRRFAPADAPGAPAQAVGWDEHRLVRLNVLLKMIEARAGSVIHALSPDCAHATPIEALIERAQNETLAGYERPLEAQQAAALRAMVQALRQQMQTVAEAGPGANPFFSVPKPELRVRPPL